MDEKVENTSLYGLDKNIDVSHIYKYLHSILVFFNKMLYTEDNQNEDRLVTSQIM